MGTYNRIQVSKGDITMLEVDVVVNAADNCLSGGGGVDGAIHRAGGPAILAECLKIRVEKGGCPTGQAVITTAGNLPARYIIHTVGPIWRGGNNGEDELLRSCYRNSLQLAVERDLKTVAFPNISTGVYRFPKKRAAQLAIAETIKFLAAHAEMVKVIFVCYDQENYELYNKLLAGQNC